MVIEKTIVTKTCDACKKEVKEFASSTEYNEAITQLIVDVYYLGKKNIDLCQDCSEKILRFIRVLEQGKN